MGKIKELAKALKKLAKEDNAWLDPDFLFQAYRNANIKSPEYDGHPDYEQLSLDIKMLLSEHRFPLPVKTALIVILEDYNQLADRSQKVSPMLPIDDILWDKGKKRRNSEKSKHGVTDLSKYRKKKGK